MTLQVSKKSENIIFGTKNATLLAQNLCVITFGKLEKFCPGEKDVLLQTSSCKQSHNGNYLKGTLVYLGCKVRSPESAGR